MITPINKYEIKGKVAELVNMCPKQPTITGYSTQSILPVNSIYQGTKRYKTQLAEENN